MSRVLIIAEAGVNHNGDPTLAFRLVDEAKAAGADAVKFQAFSADSLVSSQAPKAAYQLETTPEEQSQRNMLRSLELSPDTFHKLAAYCAERSISFLATPFDHASIDLLAAMKLPVFKVPSGEITNLPYLRKIGALGKEIFLSTGMSTLDEVAAALDILERAGTEPSSVTLLHCTTEYPAPVEEVNLHAMRTMREAFPGIKGVGYSDHTTGIVIPLAAVALGAVVIEKHFTLNRTMNGPDHKASLEPAELAQMVAAIRQVESALGDGCKTPSFSEQKNIAVVRKSIVTASRIRKGEVFSSENITTKRPGASLSPMMWDQLLGRKASRDYEQDDPIDFFEV